MATTAHTSTPGAGSERRGRRFSDSLLRVDTLEHPNADIDGELRIAAEMLNGLKVGAHPDRDMHWQGLCAACATGDSVGARRAFERGGFAPADLHARDDYALRLAIGSGDVDTVVWLLGAGDYAQNGGSRLTNPWESPLLSSAAYGAPRLVAAALVAFLRGVDGWEPGSYPAGMD